MRSFNDVNTRLTRELQDEIAEFRGRFDTEIATAWRPARHLGPSPRSLRRTSGSLR